MGKQGKQGWYNNTQAPWRGQAGQQGSDSSSSWAYWPGSWRARHKDGTDQSSVKFPAYSQTPVSQATETSVNIAPLIALDDSSSVAVCMRDLQKALTACRKSENRMRKISETRATKEQQWMQYQKEMKQAFLQNKRQFQKDLDALDKDLQQALQQSHAAISQVQSLAQGHAAAPATLEPVAMETQEEEDSWLNFIGTPGPAEVTPDQCLAQALQEAHLLAQQAQAAQAAQSVPTGLGIWRGLLTPKRATTGVPIGQPASSPACISTAAAVQMPCSSAELQNAVPATPARHTILPPRTPTLGERPLRTSVAPSHSSYSSRVVPFPPPAAVSMQDSPVPPRLSCLGSATADPYMSAGSPQGVASLGHAVSPPQGPPKPPKQRVSVKDSAKPTGPIHHRSPQHSREAQLNSKRAQLAGTLLAATIGPAEAQPHSAGPEPVGEAPHAAAAPASEPPLPVAVLPASVPLTDQSHAAHRPLAPCPKVAPSLHGGQSSVLPASAPSADLSNAALRPPAPCPKTAPPLQGGQSSGPLGTAQSFLLHDDDEDTVFNSEDLMD